MAASYPSLTVMANKWVDLCAVNTALASKALILQLKTEARMNVFFGGATAPTNSYDGISVGQYEAIKGNSAHIWVYICDINTDSNIIGFMEDDA